ncbi:rhombosortase [Massilia horti]|uniref:Rhombosortase n=1 Tax=Massilia horti TaxID=2562153 RepID=A0A4Y9T5V8_9BURK|nr:rhombosortase [Massilia horti]TFW33486.1 rhombosortase [Massilia horti]
MRAAVPLLERAPASSLLAFACVVLAFAPEAWLAHLAYERGAIFKGEVWRLWTCHLVHFSVAQAVTDALVLLSMGALAEPVVGTRRLLLAFILGGPFISLGLLASAPAMLEYRGASGIAMMAAVLAAAVMWRESSAWKVLVVALASVFAAKTLAEAGGGLSASAVLPEFARVAWQSHVLGALSGVSILALARWRSAGPLRL